MPITHDPFGNITLDRERSYIWNWENRPTTITKSGVATNYTYDEAGIRVNKNVDGALTTFIGNHTELRGSDVIRHIFAGSQRIGSIDKNNLFTYNIQDHQGSLSFRINLVKSIVKNIEYYPFARLM